jgi:hypothetical protein
MPSRLVCIAMLLSLVSCSGIKQDVHPVVFNDRTPREICMIDNEAVIRNALFQDLYKAALSRKGLTVRVLPEGTAIDACPMTTTYTARWRGGFMVHIGFANLKVYVNGRLEGEALYDALRAGPDTSRFVQPEIRIRELTELLFQT